MGWVCEDCGEVFELPYYRKDRVGNKVPCCPACSSREIEEEEDYGYDDFVEYEVFDED